MNRSFDLVILGGGAGGFASVIKAEELGAKTLMVNAGLPIGGTCVNVGCVPTKRLLYMAEVLQLEKNKKFDGIEMGIRKFDFSKVIQSELELVERMREEKYVKVIESLKNVKFIEGYATFISKNEIKVNGEIYKGKKFIIATGSRTTIPPIEGIKETGFITHIEALKIKELPKELLIIGAGPLGLEFAQMFSRFGSKVTVLELLPSIFMPGEREIVKRLERILSDEGITIKTNVRVKRAFKEGDKKVLEYSFLEGRQEIVERVSGDEILLATGRIPNTDGLNLDVTDVKVDKRKAIIVNEFLQTTNENIYAAGDVINLPLRLETTAGREGTIAAENALTNSEKSIDYDLVPYTIFTDPELSGIGLTEERLMEKIGRCSCRTVNFSNVPKAIIRERTEGMIKMVVHPDTKQVLGVHILSPNASEIIAQAMLIVKNNMTVHDIIETLPIFPSFSEAIKLCALSFISDISKLSCCV
ncbi:MAG: mercury(II) reductase [Aquificaceae bacterium]